MDSFSAATIRLDLIDREQFDVKEENGRFLINPKKSKHAWGLHELMLRSLVVDDDGRVLSAGWPKFPNRGEMKEFDAAYATAVAAKAVQYTEKMDGTLIVADSRGGTVELRTRGNHDLGDFDKPVRTLIARRYPALIEYLRHSNDFIARHSFLFEYTAPDNQIVLKYDEPALTFLGLMDKHLLEPNLLPAVLKRVARETCVPAAAIHTLPQDDAAWLVKQWENKEGVVARWFDWSGSVWMLKIKSDQYNRIHALKYRVNGRKAERLAYLLDVHTADQLRAKLWEWGLDYEAATIVEAELTDYFDRLSWAYPAFKSWLADFAMLRWHMNDRSGHTRKDYVERVRTLIAGTSDRTHRMLFNAAMRIYDADADGAVQQFWAFLLDESPITVRQWAKDRKAAVKAMLTAPVPADE